MAVYFRLSQLIARFGGELRGDDVEISRIVPLNAAAVSGDLVFVTHKRYCAELKKSNASAVIISPQCAPETQLPAIVTPDPYLYFAKVAQLLTPRPVAVPSVHRTACIGEGCEIDASVQINEFVSLGQRVRIGAGAIIHAGCVIGDEVEIGAHTVLYPRVTVYARSLIGADCVIHAGAVIGSDGFGMAWGGVDEGWVDIPQTGRVVIEDNVHIGANTTIDRGALSDTYIERGVRLDNQIQIAHNVRVGQQTAMAACVGVAGSTQIGARCMIGGAGMISGHLTLGDGVHISGGTLVASSIHEAGQYTAVYPLSSHQEWMRNAAHIRQLPRLRERVRQLEKQCASMPAGAMTAEKLPSQ